MVVAALAMVALLVLRASQRSPFDLTWLDRAVLRLTSPIESALRISVPRRMPPST